MTGAGSDPPTESSLEQRRIEFANELGEVIDRINTLKLGFDELGKVYYLDEIAEEADTIIVLIREAREQFT